VQGLLSGCGSSAELSRISAGRLRKTGAIHVERLAARVDFLRIFGRAAVQYLWEKATPL
jgi:hypothetical protein